MLMIGNSAKDFPFRCNIDSGKRRRIFEIHESGSADLGLGFLAGDLPAGLYLRLLACYVSLLANICVLYHIISEKSKEINKKLRALTLCS